MNAIPVLNTFLNEQRRAAHMTKLGRSFGIRIINAYLYFSRLADKPSRHEAFSIQYTHAYFLSCRTHVLPMTFIALPSQAQVEAAGVSPEDEQLHCRSTYFQCSLGCSEVIDLNVTRFSCYHSRNINIENLACSSQKSELTTGKKLHVSFQANKNSLATWLL